MASYTTLFHLGKPTVGGDADVWGTILNTVIDMLDAALGYWTITGSSSAYVLTTGFTLPSYVNGQRFFVKWNHTNASTSPTLNVDGLGAKSIKKRDGTTSPSASDLVSGRYNEVIYDGTNMVLNDWVASDFQARDSTLDALAGLTTAASQYIRATGTDAFTMDSYATVLSNIGALNTTSGDARYAQLASTPTFTTEMVISAATPALTQRETDASNIRWIRTSSAGVFQEILSNDAFSIFNAYRQVSQSAAVVTLIEELYPHVAPLAAVTGVSGTLTTAHRNRHLELSGGVTMPNSVFTAQDKQTFDPGTSSRTFTRGSGVTMYVNGVDSASATLAANQGGGAHWRTTSVVMLTGAFL